MTPRELLALRFWLERYCLSLDGQFLFLDPVSWQTFQLSEGAVTVLREAADATERGMFDAFLDDVVEAGGWPPRLEFLVRSLTTLQGAEGSTVPE